MAKLLSKVFEKKFAETFANDGISGDESSSDIGESESDDERTRKLHAIQKKVSKIYFTKLYKMYIFFSYGKYKNS